ncbi:MAG: transporter, partial [Chthoniobacter sp.]|nr:transporter [Chthoniobacter sp.]
LIRNQTGGGLNLVKTGLGTQEVRNIPAQGHNFNSATINQGKLVFNLNTLPGGGAGHNVLGANVSITVNTGGVLGLDGTWNMTRPVFGTGDVFKQGTGNVTISAASFHTGNTILSQGILTAATPGGGALPGNVIMGTGVQDDIFLVMGAENQFGPTSVIDFNNGPALDAKFELRGFNQTVAGLESDADDDLSIVQNQENGTPLPATLTINATTDHVFHGIIRTQAGGVLSLVKNGPGSQELRNVPATGYTFGPATINAGKLVFNFQSLPGGGAGHDTLGANIATTVNAGGALGLDGTWAMNAPVSGTGDLIKQGAETVTVSGFQVNHTGNTNVAAGTLLVTGSISGTAKVDVQSGATLGGNGSIAPATALTGDINLLAGGKLSPGVGGPGILSATLSGGGEFDLSLAVDSANSRALLFELDSNFNSDAVMLTGGALNIGSGKLAFDDFEFAPFAGFNLDTTYTLFDGALPIVGTLAAANLGGPIGPYFGTLALSDGGTDLVLVVTIPEPTAMAGLLGGLGFLLTRRRRAASK